MKIMTSFFVLIAFQSLTYAASTDPQKVQDPFHDQTFEKRQATNKELKNQERQEEDPKRDPLGEFSKNPAYDNGNGTTTNKRIKWPEP